MVAMERFIRRRFGALAFVTLGLLTFSEVDVDAGNTTCAGNLTDWYTNAVGETACETYQRLRQICNQDYQVPSFRPNTPGDNCDDQLPDCCCNSISWALSMLCMNCQWDVLGGSTIGIDAGVGAYGIYRNPSGTFCSPGANQSLPADVQTAVCNLGLKLDNFLYELFWTDGSWYFVYTTEYAGEQQIQFNNNTFTNCNSTTSTTTRVPVSTLTSVITAATSATQKPTASSLTTSSHSNTASVVGGVVGSIAGLALVLGAGFLYWRKRGQPRASPKATDVIPFTLTSLDPPQPTFTQQARYRHVHSNSSSDLGSRSETRALNSSQGTSDDVPSDPLTARHEDLGPVTTLNRSASGRLPPAYNPQWESPRRPQARPLPQPTSTQPPLK